jgi:MoaA/NifB/PqqE/SkfB family radical SAM enzyme
MNPKAIIKNPKYYYNRLLQEVELRAGMSCSKPSEVWLKLTERCNCRCQMCDIWKNNQTSEGELTTEDWKNVLSGLRQWLGKEHIWFTGGEPFLRKDCIDLIKHGSSIGLSIAVITNGILLKPEQMHLLFEAGLKEYHVSIDSMNPEIHDHLRGRQGAHKRVTGSVIALKDYLNRTGKEMKIVIKTIIMGYNVKEILPLMEWVDKNRFDEIKFQPLESNLEGADDPHWFNHSFYWPKGKEVEDLVGIMDKLIAKKETGGNIYNSVQELKNIREYFLSPITYYERAKNHVLSVGEDKQECKGVMTWMEILSRGGLRICRYMSPQGDVRKQTPRGLWKTRPTCWKKPAELCFK